MVKALSGILLIFGLMVMASNVSLADEHPLTTLTGPGIDLKVYDHAMAGSIKDFVVWGFVDEETFTSELIMRKDGQVIRSIFKKQEDGKIGGTVSHTVDGKAHETTLHFLKLDKAASKLILSHNGQPVEVTITADSFENNHFGNPTYKTVVDGQEYSYTLKGSACYSYSLHLAFVMLGALTH